MVKNVWEMIQDPDRCFIIAEAGVNHNGNLETALKMIEAACEFNADAVKFQTFRAEKLVTSNAPKADYQIKNTGAEETHLEMLKCLELSFEDHFKLFEYCNEKNILFMSTPFDEDSVDLLWKLGVQLFKIPSGEITNLPLLSYIAKNGKPIILSTGMACLGEVEQALNTIHSTGNIKISLLHCTTNYPVNPEDINLRAIDTLRNAFKVPIGFSDHSMGIEASLAAVSRGARVIEKHFTLSRNMEGPDHSASLEPNDFKNMVKGIRFIEAALGNGIKKPVPSEMNSTIVIRKSLVASKDLPVGTILSNKNITCMRPGTGIPPSMLPHLLGRIVNKHVTAGSLITMDMIG